MDAHRSGDVETPTKKGTFAKIKEAVLSPLKNLSPTKAHADYFEFTKNANSPSLQSKVVMRRNSSRRRIKLTSSPRKGTQKSDSLQFFCAIFKKNQPLLLALLEVSIALIFQYLHCIFYV